MADGVDREARAMGLGTFRLKWLDWLVKNVIDPSVNAYLDLRCQIKGHDLIDVGDLGTHKLCKRCGEWIIKN